MPAMLPNSNPDSSPQSKPSSSGAAQPGAGARNGPLTHTDPETGEKIVNMEALLKHKDVTQDKYKHTQANLERNQALEREGKGKGHDEL